MGDGAVVMTQEELLRQIIREYLLDKGATLWGRAYDVNDPDGMEAAVDFITDLYLDLWDLEYKAQER